MAYNLEFHVTKPFEGLDEMDAITFENDLYHIEFIYAGNYVADKKNNRLSCHKIVSVCRKKNKSILPIKYQLGYLVIDIQSISPDFPPEYVDQVMELLSRAKASAEALRTILKEYFPVIDQDAGH